MTRTLTNIDFSIVIIIGGYLVHIQYNVVSSNTKLYLFLRVVVSIYVKDETLIFKWHLQWTIVMNYCLLSFPIFCILPINRIYILSLDVQILYFLHNFLFNYTLYLYIGVAFASARTIEVAHGKIPREKGGELIFEHVVKTKFTRRKRTLICDEHI